MQQHNNKDIESYVLRSYNDRNEHSAESFFLHSGHRWCLLSTLTWVAPNVFVIFDSDFIRVLPMNVAVVIIMPVVVAFTFIQSKGKFNRYMDGTEKQCNTSANKASTFGMLGAIGGVGVARIVLPNVMSHTQGIIISLVFCLLVLGFISCACVQYYKVHLIRKFCPNLRCKKE
ncbi:MAG: hypothetical protein FWB96_08315 [Defluviitaleaceae bacterium]|nr:hypothetical protein [Defluviitaleaceae bacterium]MCL2224953.1 hypothetical protein [Defluviitaleaceae bacterium]MCL2262486.1 hypothetical protein [Defluviitaleaceae bacterium]